MHHGLWIRNTSAMPSLTVVELARTAERAGWDGVFVSDAVAEDHTEPFGLLGAIAAVTERVRLGTWVVPVAARDVVAVARGAGVVDDLSAGRLLVGVGLGNPVEHAALGVGETGAALAARYDASIEVLAALLAGETVSRHDDWFDLEDVSLNVTVPQDPRPPILCAASWPARAGVRRGARWDGMMPYWPGLGEGDDPAVAEGARESELRELVSYYREHGGDGAIVAPALARFGDGYVSTCDELGVEWLLWCDRSDAAQVAAGPG